MGKTKAPKLQISPKIQLNGVQQDLLKSVDYYSSSSVNSPRSFSSTSSYDSSTYDIPDEFDHAQSFTSHVRRVKIVTQKKEQSEKISTQKRAQCQADIAWSIALQQIDEASKLLKPSGEKIQKEQGLQQISDIDFITKVQDIVMKFGFRNKEVIIQEENTSEIQLTTRMSSVTSQITPKPAAEINKQVKPQKKPARRRNCDGKKPVQSCSSVPTSSQKLNISPKQLRCDTPNRCQQRVVWKR